MRARVAYMSSLGTTAILVAAALLMLAVVGAIVAFRGWPGGADGPGVQSVPLAPAAPTRVALVRRVATGTRIVRTSASRAAVGRVSSAGVVKSGGGGPVVAGLVMVPVHSSPMQPVSPQRGVPGVPGGPTGQPGAPVPVPDRPNPVDPGPLPAGPGSLPVPIASPADPSPTTDQVAAMVGQLFAIPPPPRALAGASARLH
jgi:hypothetical protein